MHQAGFAVIHEIDAGVIGSIKADQHMVCVLTRELFQYSVQVLRTYFARSTGTMGQRGQTDFFAFVVHWCLRNFQNSSQRTPKLQLLF
jgi:hypothetical protein